MRKSYVTLVIAGLLVAGTFGLIQVAQGQGRIQPDGSEAIRSEVDGDNVRSVVAPPDVDASNISFIESLTPYCFQPDSSRDECFINWRSLSVEAAPASMEAMTVTLDAVGVVARYQGYFQESMFVSYDMHGRGFRVACGSPDASGEPQLGIGYDWTIEAEDTAGLVSTNTGTLYCPPFAP